MPAAHRLSRDWRRWLVAGVATLAALVAGAPFLYIHVLQGPTPGPLRLSGAPAATSATPTSAAGAATRLPSRSAATAAGPRLTGAYVVGAGSEAGYRVQEVLAGQGDTAVGRTRSVTGSIRVVGDTVTAGTFTVDMRTVRSNESLRDVQYNGRIMDTAAYPDAAFALTQPIRLPASAAGGTAFSVVARGRLTLHGATRTVAVRLRARVAGTTAEVSGDIPVVFAPYGIGDPSFAGFVTVDSHGLAEFLLVAHRR